MVSSYLTSQPITVLSTRTIFALPLVRNGMFDTTSLPRQDRFILKSSTPSPSVQALRVDKRFDALVKQEMVEHQRIISSHHKEMQALRDLVNSTAERYDSLLNRVESRLLELTSEVEKNVGLIKETLSRYEIVIYEQKKTILEFYNHLENLHLTYSNKVEVEKFKKDVDVKLNESTRERINSFQEAQRETKFLVQTLSEDVAKLKREIQNQSLFLKEEIEHKSSVSKIDKDGVLAHIKSYDKSIFIIEKKIENIYTLIDRINKRGEVCHKPV